MSFLDENSVNMKGVSIDEIYVGQRKSFTKTVTEADVNTFAGLTGDFNPVHVNAEYAKTSRFGGKIAHGMLTASFISTVFGMTIPGADGIYLGQTIKFLAPVRIGDTITAAIEVIKVMPEKKRFYARTTVTNQRGELVIDGEATLMATKRTS